jgi:hypothetical protein
MKYNPGIRPPASPPGWQRPKPKFKARECPPSEAYRPYAAVSAG